jgi:hypothetical protein
LLLGSLGLVWGKFFPGPDQNEKKKKNKIEGREQEAVAVK